MLKTGCDIENRDLQDQEPWQYHPTSGSFASAGENPTPGPSFSIGSSETKEKLLREEGLNGDNLRLIEGGTGENSDSISMPDWIDFPLCKTLVEGNSEYQNTSQAYKNKKKAWYLVRLIGSLLMLFITVAMAVYLYEN